MPIILIIVGIIVALGFGGFVYLKPPAEDNSQTVSEVSIRPEETAPTSTPAISETDTATPVNSQTATPTPPANPPAKINPTPPTPSVPVVVQNNAYKNGEYIVTTSYVAPGRSTHTVTTQLTLKDDIVTATNVTFAGDSVKTSTEYQNKFVAAFSNQVVGKKLDTVSLSRSGGASLTTNAFNKAIAEVKNSAKS